MPAITEQTARQRYERVPVMEDDPDRPGEQRQKTIEVRSSSRRKKGTTTRKRVFVNDLNKPLDPQVCEKCGDKILPGQKYRCCAIKRTYGGTFRIRCINCPTWQPWEYTDALWARVAQIQAEDTDGSEWETEEDAEGRRDELSSMIEELLGEKQEALDNMPDGLRDASELNDRVSELEDWKQEMDDALSGVDFPEGECSNCGGEQLEHEEHTDECPEDCDGTEECMECHGTNEGDLTEGQLADWRQEASDALREALDNASVG